MEDHRGPRPWQTCRVLYAFGDCELDLDASSSGAAAPSARWSLRSSTSSRCSSRERDRVVTKEEILDTVWGDRFVSESALTSRIKALRRPSVTTARHSGSCAPSTGAATSSSPTSPTSGRTASSERRSRHALFRRKRSGSARPTDGVRLAYATMGAGPPLVKVGELAHPSRLRPGDAVWRHWLVELSRRYRLVRYDERGCGLSDWDVPDFSLDAWVRDLEAVVDAAGLERFPLLGISQGGPVAIAYAVRNPERVSHLVLLGSFAQGRRKRAQTAEDVELVEAYIDHDAARLGSSRPAVPPDVRVAVPAGRAPRRSGGRSTSSSAARPRRRTRGGS